MNIVFKKYFRFWFWIDLVGLCLSVILIISYLIWGDNFDDHIQNLWSNLAIEVLGVWLSVRIIDFLIQRHKTFKETRFKQLDNLGYFDNIANHILQYSPSHQRDIEILQREITYFDKRWLKRQKQFYEDEKVEIQTLRQLMPTIISTCVELELTGNQPISRERYSELKQTLRQQLYEFRTLLEQLRENVWEESHPDD